MSEQIDKSTTKRMKCMLLAYRAVRRRADVAEGRPKVDILARRGGGQAIFPAGR